MALASTSTVSIQGVSGIPVRVEANVGPGLPGIHMVGLGDASIRESRDRIRTAARNVGLPWPKTKVTVNLSPASLPKSGAHFDLAVVLAIQAALLENDSVHSRLARAMVVGEVALDGQIRPVQGVLAAVSSGLDAGCRYILVPAGNAAQAAVSGSDRVYGVNTLQEAFGWLIGDHDLPRVGTICAPEVMEEQPVLDADYGEIIGQAEAKRAAEIAAAGGHHFMMVGPPGSGNSMIATALPSILPPLTASEVVEVTTIHSLHTSVHYPVRRAPFVAPHHSITRAGMLGGGVPLRPGAISLAHRGVLFLDEASELPSRILDSLRIPLEHGEVRLQRSHREVLFPARFQLVLAANPCRCGAAEEAKCTCVSSQRSRYLSNLSGPLRDRLDMVVHTQAGGKLHAAAEADSSAVIAERVLQARERARHRWSRAGLADVLNGEVRGPRLRRDFPPDEVGLAMLETHLVQGNLTQRGIDRTVKVAWTLADLAGDEQPGIAHVVEALNLQQSITDSE